MGNHYAALGAWESQLTDLPLTSDRKVNLRAPADATHDAGAHGMFDDRARGFMDPSFLKSLPNTARIFAKALSRTFGEKQRRYERDVSLWMEHRR